MGRLLFRYLEPTFCAGLLDDPVLYLHVRPLGRAILIDCGQLHHLAKRVLKSLDAIFVSHAHMDHFMGFDTLVRHIHVSPRTVELFGPPGIAARVAAKLAGYDWNLAEASWCTFRVHEVHPDRLQHVAFPGAAGFSRREEGETARRDRTIWHNDFLTVEAALCDHKIPSLAFRISERPTFWIDADKVRQAGLVPGEWLRELKRRFYQGTLADGGLTVLRQRGDEVGEDEVADPGALLAAIRQEQTPASIGYLTDIAMNAANLATVLNFLGGVTLLACEASFLAADRAKARTSHHLCTSDVNLLARELRPAFLLPMHLSKSNNGRSDELYGELSLPATTVLLRFPEHLTPRPLLPAEFPRIGRR